jgi:hypothetical protein
VEVEAEVEVVVVVVEEEQQIRTWLLVGHAVEVDAIIVSVQVEEANRSIFTGSCQLRSIGTSSKSPNRTTSTIDDFLKPPSPMGTLVLEATDAPLLPLRHDRGMCHGSGWLSTNLDLHIDKIPLNDLAIKTGRKQPLTSGRSVRCRSTLGSRRSIRGIVDGHR